MALFGRKPGKKEIDDAKKAAREHPCPATTATLIQRYIDFDEFDEALEAAQYGLNVYPHSSSIRQAYRYVKRKESAGELKSLKENIQTQPRPNHFQRLAEIYYDLGEEDQAMEYAVRGIAEYPEFEGNYLIVGKMRYDRWKDDALPKDGLNAVQNFERAHELNRENYKTLLALGQIYLIVGAKAWAEERLKAILFLAPDDQRARELLNTARSLPDGEDDFDLLLQSYFEKRKSGEIGDGAGDGGDTKYIKINKNPRALTEKVGRLADIPGFVGAIVLARNQEVVASHFTRSEDEMEYASQVGGIYKAAQVSSLQMDIGGFHRAYLECGTGTIFMAHFEDMLFVLIGDRNAKTDRFESEAEKFLESTIYES